VTAYDKPTHLAVRIGNERFAFDVDYRLSDLGGRTRLDYTAQAPTPGGLAAVANVLFSWLARSIARKQMKRLKAVAESRA
jgi:carbon monoxide dehydrogenase subunit G